MMNQADNTKHTSGLTMLENETKEKTTTRTTTQLNKDIQNKEI